jgi:LamB porin
LNWWPLDNQNTVGGGVSYTLGRGAEGDTMLAFHVGMQRLDTPFQVQTREVPNPTGLGTVTFLQLDRPRTIETVKLTHFLRNGPGRQVFADDRKGIKLSLYGELHQLPAGVQREPLTERERGLPADSGWMAGAQFGYYTGQRDQYVNVFLRHARGLAAYDPLATPGTFANNLSVSTAFETQVAVATNWESNDFGVQAAGYLRFFRDGSESATSTGKYDEGTVVVRPHWFATDHFGLAGEASYQLRRTAVPNANADGLRTAGVTRFALMPYFSPAGRGTFKRPQLRMIYSVALRDAGARALYAPDDPTSRRNTEHFLGLSAEWWFNSSSYP